MASPLLNQAESWERVYQAFESINFTAYDYDAVKQSLLDYIKFNYPEHFNDYTEQSQLIAIIEAFAYVAEILAYRVDMSVHETLLSTATRKQSILKLAKLISYTASRNIPLRGLVKLTSISTSEDVRDSQGNSLSNRVIKWNDQTNPLWREQFFIVLNKILTQRFGEPFKTFQVDDTIFNQYELQNVLETEADRSSFKNGVLKFKVPVNGQDLNFEVVPADVDQDGVLERSPNPNAYFTLLYADDGRGDSSDTTGFMLYVKQGTLQKLSYVFDSKIPNRSLSLNVSNVNDVDVWVQQVDQQGVIVTEWTDVPNVDGINLAFNNIKTRTKYEIETLEDDKINLHFGDGDFSDIPTGIFNIWLRSSNSGSAVVTKNQIVDQPSTFLYTSKLGKQESCTFTYSLVSALQNSSDAEDIEHIRSSAPSVYYTQDRMVNGKDYNSYFLKDSSILRLKAINRTFAGQSKYLDWNDASGTYQNVKIFGDDLRFYYDIGVQTKIVTTSSRNLIDSILEPALSSPGLANLLIYIFATAGEPFNQVTINPRTRFIEDISETINNLPVQEKTELQGALDRHWYGEPDSTVLLDVNLNEISTLTKSPYALVNGDTDHLIYDSNLKLVVKNEGTGLYSLFPTPGNISGIQDSAVRQKKFGIRYQYDRAFNSNLKINSITTLSADVVSDSLLSTDIVQSIAVEETFTIQVINLDGTFTVNGSITGEYSSGSVGEQYTNGVLSFFISAPTTLSPNLTVGDSFIVKISNISGIFTPSINKKNLNGRYQLIDEAELPNDVETLPFNQNNPNQSWLMIIERIDSITAPSYWKITTRDFKLIAESSTTKFWYDTDLALVDQATKLKVRDEIKLLKSNLNASRNLAIGVDIPYSVIDNVKYSDGQINTSALSITPSSLINVGNKTVSKLLEIISLTDYVYFLENATTGRISPIKSTPFIRSRALALI